MAEIGIAIAALAGVGSFVAPCILPMIPAFLAYISGTTVADLAQKGGATVTINRGRILLNTVFFVLGFSVVFSTLGVLINSVLYEAAEGILGTLNYVGGVIIIGFGVFLLLSTSVTSLSTAKLNIGTKSIPMPQPIRKIVNILAIILNTEKKFFPSRDKAGVLMSFVFGLAFAVGWTPCVGPVLGTILTLAATTPSAAFNLLLAYSLGLGIPFLLMGAFFSRATRIVRAMSCHLKYYSILLGAFIIALGALVLTGQLEYIANFPLLNELVLLG